MIDLKELVEQYKNVYLEAKGEEFPSGKEVHFLIFNTQNVWLSYRSFGKLKVFL